MMAMESGLSGSTRRVDTLALFVGPRRTWAWVTVTLRLGGVDGVDFDIEGDIGRDLRTDGEDGGDG